MSHSKFTSPALHVAVSMVSIAALASGIAAWPEAFLFGKVMRLPELASGFPWPTTFPKAWILLCVLGPALTAPSFRRAAWSVVVVLLISAALALGALPLPSAHPVANSLFNLAWIVGFHGGPPIAVSLLLAGARAFLRHDEGLPGQ